MSAPKKTAKDARRKFVFERQAIPTIAFTLGVSESTVRRWKSAARANGDNWDLVKSANMISGEGMEATVADMIERFVVQFQATISDLEADKSIGAIDRAKVLTSLSDAFAKTVASAGRVAPKISELSVATDVVKRFADYVQANYPQHAVALLEVLEPFGVHLTEVYE